MKFILKTSANIYSANDIEPLKELGFTFNGTSGLYRIDNEPTIKIRTLKDLMKFVKDYGRIVLDSDSIEIYDDYRE